MDRWKPDADCLKRLVDQIGENVFILDTKGRFVFINRHGLKTSKYTRAILGKKFTSIVAPRHKKDATAAFLQVLRGKRLSNLEVEVIYKNGKHVLLELRGEPLKKDGKIMGIVGTARDVTARNKAEDALREAEEKYEAIVENAGDAIVILKNKKITYANKQMLKLTGYTMKEAMGKSMTHFITKNSIPAVLKNYSLRMAGKPAPRTYEITIKKKGGGNIIVEVYGTVVTINGEKADFVYLNDITARKKAEHELRAKIKELEKFRKFAVGRELKMLNLKKKLRELEKK